MSMAPSQINYRIAAAHERLASLDQEAKTLSLAAVSGDQDAAAALERINAEVQRITVDLAVLERAKAAATEQQIAASEAENAAYRAHHMAIAKDRAAAIVKLATRADELVAECKRVFGDLAATEERARKALREAGAPTNDGVVGQKGLQVFAMDALTAFTSGTDHFRKPRPVADVAAAAWRDLLQNDEI